MRARSWLRGLSVMALLALSLGACGAPKAAKPPPKPHPKPASGWVTYTNKVVGVSVRHPRGWRPVQGYLWRIGGTGGFLQLQALDGAGWTVQEAATHEASQQLHPFGTSPTLTPLRAGGEAAYLITPSADVSVPGAPGAELVVKYPVVHTIQGSQYSFLIVDATPTLIRRIAVTLRFLP